MRTVPTRQELDCIRMMKDLRIDAAPRRKRAAFRLSLRRR
jgi:hypothetical protein